MVDIDSYVLDLTDSLKKIWQLARERDFGARERQLRVYEKTKGQDPELKQGDLVALKIQAMPRGKTRKLAPQWKGPLKIAQVKAPSVLLRNPKGGRTQRQHMRNVKPYFPRKEGD